MVRRRGRNASGRFIKKGGKSDTPVSDKVSPVKREFIISLTNLNYIFNIFVLAETETKCSHDPNNNVQCMAYSMIVLILLKKCQILQVDPAFINSIMEAGDTLMEIFFNFNNIIKSHSFAHEIYSSIENPSEFFENIVFNSEISDNQIILDKVFMLFYEFKNALNKIFKNNEIFILTVSSKSMCQSN